MGTQSLSGFYVLLFNPADRGMNESQICPSISLSSAAQDQEACAVELCLSALGPGDRPGDRPLEVLADLTTTQITAI